MYVSTDSPLTFSGITIIIISRNGRIARKIKGEKALRSTADQS
jgi:hypothetical protein